MRSTRNIATALHSVCVSALILCLVVCAVAAQSSAPAAPGKLVDLGGHKLHVNCTGKGSPKVVIENGLGDFSFDWILVQNKVAAFTRVCTYDRAGYPGASQGPSRVHSLKSVWSCGMRWPSCMNRGRTYS